MRMYPYIILFGLFGTTNCQHQPELVSADTSGKTFCTEIAGDSLCAYQWSSPPPAYGNEVTPEQTVHYTCPSINPNNPNQFVCFKQDFNWPPEVSIITYDMNTGVENVLFTFSGVMHGNLLWGKKDWIAFTQGQGNIRIFKSDGSNDHQIVESSRMNFGSGSGPSWTPDGNMINYYKINPTIGFLCDTTGTISSNYEVITMPSWNQKKTLS